MDSSFESDMTTPEPPARRKRLLLLLAGGACAGAAVLAMLWLTHPDLEYWKSLADAGRRYLAERSWALFLALAILPGLGFPVSPLLILAGLVLPERYGLVGASLFGILAQGLCSVWSYFAATGPLRGLLQTLFLRDRTLPELTRRNALRVSLLVRITPGIPFAAQNYALGILRVPFPTYLLVSLPIQSLYGIGFIVTSGALYKGRTGLAITGILLIIAMIVATRVIVGFRRQTDA